MSYPGLPPYLQPFCAPGSFVDTRTNQIVWHTPEQVAQLYQQWHNEQLQQEHRRLQQLQAQQFNLGAGPYLLQHQLRAQPPIYNYGHMNVSSTNVGGRQPGYGNYNIGGQQISYQQQAPYVSPNNSEINFGGCYASFAPLRVQNAQPQALGASASAPMDLTDDFLNFTEALAPKESVAASQPIISEKVKATPAPTPKSDPTAWRNSKDYLTKELNHASWANRGFLFGSLKEVPAIKRNNYVTAHWPTKEAALEDIIEMSQYFIDAAEMISYRLKWDRIESDLASGKLSKDEEDKACKELIAEQDRLQSELSDKRRIKLDRIEAARDGQWIDGMRKPEFERRFEQTSSLKNKRKLKAERDAELEKDRVLKKSRTKTTSKAGGSQSSAPKPEPKPETTTTGKPPSQPEPEWELNEEDFLAELREQDTGPSPSTDSPQEEDTVVPQDVTVPQEQVTAPSLRLRELSPSKVTGEHARFDETPTIPAHPMDVTLERLTTHMHMENSLNEALEQTTADVGRASPSATAHSGWASSSASPILPSKKRLPTDEALGEEQTAASSTPSGAPAAAPRIGRWDVTGRFVPDEESVVAAEDEGYNSLFDDDGDAV